MTEEQEATDPRRVLVAEYELEKARQRGEIDKLMLDYTSEVAAVARQALNVVAQLADCLRWQQEDAR